MTGEAKHARFAEQFQRDGRADDVHDGIHRADFVKVNFAGRQAVNFSLGLGDALKHGNGFLLHPRGEFAPRDQFLDFGKIASVIGRMIVARPVFTMVIVIVRVFVGEMNIKFHAGDGGFLPARNVKVIAVELELFQLAFELARVHAEIEQRGDEHVSGDAAEEVEVKGFHFSETSALIWLAA